MELSQKYLDLVNEVKTKIKELDIITVKKMLDDQVDFVLIDVREESEWNNNRIPGAFYIGKGILEREIEKMVPCEDTKLVLYCGGGYRSALSAENLQKMGYKNVYSLMGGISEWEEENLPITTM